MSYLKGTLDGESLSGGKEVTEVAAPIVPLYTVQNSCQRIKNLPK